MGDEKPAVKKIKVEEVEVKSEKKEKTADVTAEEVMDTSEVKTEEVVEKKKKKKKDKKLQKRPTAHWRPQRMQVCWRRGERRKRRKRKRRRQNNCLFLLQLIIIFRLEEISLAFHSAPSTQYIMMNKTFFFKK